MPDKPAQGSPCNHCGWCCQHEVCVLGQKVFDQIKGPCPALRMGDDGQSACGLAADPKVFAPALTKRNGTGRMKRSATYLIGSGIGCDAQTDEESRNRAFDVWLNDYRERTRPDILKAAKVWRVGVPTT